MDKKTQYRKINSKFLNPETFQAEVQAATKDKTTVISIANAISWLEFPYSTIDGDKKLPLPDYLSGITIPSDLTAPWLEPSNVTVSGENEISEATIDKVIVDHIAGAPTDSDELRGDESVDVLLKASATKVNELKTLLGI